MTDIYISTEDLVAAKEAAEREIHKAVIKLIAEIDKFNREGCDVKATGLQLNLDIQSHHRVGWEFPDGFAITNCSIDLPMKLIRRN